MTDQNPPQPPSGDGSQETWRQPSTPWQKSTDAGGTPPPGQSTPPPAPIPPWGTSPSGQTGEEQTHLAWPGATPQPAGPQQGGPPPGGQQWGAQPSPDQSWPPQPGGAPGWGQQPGPDQGWGQQPGPDQGWGQQAGPDQGWGQQPGGWPQQQGGYGAAQPTGPYQGTSPQYSGQAAFQQAPPGGHPQQAGGYPPPGAWPQGAPPPPPQRKKTNPVLIIVPLAVVAAIVLGVVIALAVGGGDGKDSVASPLPTPAITNLPQVPGTVAAPPPTVGASPPAGVDNCVPVTAQGAAPAGVAAIGGSGTVVGEANSSVSDFEAKVTLNTICSTTSKVTDYGDPPVQGAFYVINVTVEVSRGDTSASPSDFYIQTADGTRYDGSYDEVAPRLSATDVKVGQKVRGNIVIDAPPGHGVLNWEPLFAVTPAKFQL